MSFQTPSRTVDEAPEKPPRQFEVVAEEPIVAVSQAPVQSALPPANNDQEMIPKNKRRKKKLTFVQRLSNLFGCASNKGN